MEGYTVGRDNDRDISEKVNEEMEMNNGIEKDERMQEEPSQSHGHHENGNFLDLQKQDFSEDDNKETDGKGDILYGILDVPPWYISIPLAIQHNLELVTASVAVPFLLSPALCLENDDPDKAKLISTLIFMSGILTLMQSTLGNTLPICQGGSFSYLVPALAIMNLPKWRCPSNLSALSPEQKSEEWQMRMREIQGAIIIASMVEMLLALTGCIGYLTKFVTPITVAPAITLIGLSLFKKVMIQCSKNYIVAFSMTLLLILFSQHLRRVSIPIPKRINSQQTANNKRSRFPIFQVLPILLALIVVWTMCGILTVANVLPVGDPARVDAKKKIIEEASWFRVPYPFQFGWPTVSIGAVLGILCGVLTSTVESIGDYYCCASIISNRTFQEAPIPPEHAMNRGIFVEGLGCVLNGIIGSGSGSTSYSPNIGTLGITKVGSRRVIQWAGCSMILFGLVGKAGAIFVSLPDPILGGMFLFLFPLVMAIGISNLKDVSLDSSRNIFIVSFSIFLGLAVSQWVGENPNLIQTSSPNFNSIVQILLSTGMFVAGFTAFILDNTVYGTDEERGLTKRKAAAIANQLRRDPTYDLPIGMGFLERYKRITRWIPISPTYDKRSITLPRWNRGGADLHSDNHPTHLPS